MLLKRKGFVIRENLEVGNMLIDILLMNYFFLAFKRNRYFSMVELPFQGHVLGTELFLSIYHNFEAMNFEWDSRVLTSSRNVNSINIFRKKKLLYQLELSGVKNPRKQSFLQLQRVMFNLHQGRFLSLWHWGHAPAPY